MPVPAGHIFAVGDILQLKKNHPCGGSQWEVLRIGMDFRLKCLKCGHAVMLPRVDVAKNTKKIIAVGAVNNN